MMLGKILLLICLIALANAGIIGTNYIPATSVSYSSPSNPVDEKTSRVTYTKISEAPPVYESILSTKESKFNSPDGTKHSTFSKSYDTVDSSAKKYESKSLGNGEVTDNFIPEIYSTAVHSPILYHPQAAYTVSSPVHSIHTPVFSKFIPDRYTTHSIPLTKTIVSPSITSYTTPILSKTTSSDYASYSSPLGHSVSIPVLTKSVSLPVTYANHEIPLTKTIVSPTLTNASVVTKTSAITSSQSSYSLEPKFEGQPIKTTVTYSQAPVVSHMSFTGLGTSYAW